MEIKNFEKSAQLLGEALDHFPKELEKEDKSRVFGEKAIDDKANFNKRIGDILTLELKTH